MMLFRCLLLCACCAIVTMAQQRTSADTSTSAMNLGPMVNSQYDDILPVISPDGKTLYFCRSHTPDNFGGGRQDIWVAELQADGTWGEAKNIGIPLNNRDNNYLCSITPDGNTALVGDGYSDGRLRARSVAIAYRTAEGWSTPQPLTIKNYYNNDRYGEFALSNDGKTLVMTVDRDGTKGAKDLYVSFQQEDGTWSEPLNMGDSVNSVNSEVTPFIASDNTSLYFASDGHGGFGSFDVFVSRRLDSTWTRWSKPENLGSTINTSGWDLYYTVPADGRYAYYVSYTNTYGAGDIFRIKLPEVARPRPVILVSGRVLNKSNGQPVEASIAYELLPSGKEVGIARSTPATGTYTIALPAGDRYGFRASADGYLSVNENIDLTQVTEYTELTRDLFLVPIEKGAVLQLNNIFFDVNASALRPESFPELDRLAKAMSSTPSMRVEIAGHTDNRGNDALNTRLSMQRAEAVRSYLTSTRNVAAERLVAKGYGKSKPVATNDTDEGRQLNRRVEFIILTK